MIAHWFVHPDGTIDAYDADGNRITIPPPQAMQMLGESAFNYTRGKHGAPEHNRR